MNKLCKSCAGALVTLVAIAALNAPSIASAQAAQGNGNWVAWAGCWRPDAPGVPGLASGALAGQSSATVCIVPSRAQGPSAAVAAAGNGAQIVTIAGGKIAIDTITAGVSRTRTVQGCTGPESAQWSMGGRRLYLKSNLECSGGSDRTSAGMFAISPDGKWVNVEMVKAGTYRSVNVMRYSPTAIPESLPQDLANALRTEQLATGAARAAASATLATSDVIDASRNTDSTVVSAWILDRRQPFRMDASTLVALADAGVPSAVTDAMVAVTYPKAFTVAAPGIVASGDAAPVLAEPDRAAGRDVRVMMMPDFSAFGYGFTPYGYPYGYAPYGYAPYGYSPFGYSPYGYSPYGYSPYGYSGYGGLNRAYAGYGGYYGAPVIVLKGSAPVERGYVVKGRGYTQSQPEVQQGSAQPRSTATAPPPQSSPSQGNTNGQQAPPRTAHERP